MATLLFQNREALAPLVARLGMPGDDWLLTEEEEFKKVLGAPDGVSQTSPGCGREARSGLTETFKVDSEDVFDARQAMDQPSGVASIAQLKQLLKSEVVRNLFGDLVDTNPEQVLEMLQTFSRPPS